MGTAEVEPFRHNTYTIKVLISTHSLNLIAFKTPYMNVTMHALHRNTEEFGVCSRILVLRLIKENQMLRSSTFMHVHFNPPADIRLAPSGGVNAGSNIDEVDNLNS